LREHEYPPSAIYNVDETGFSIGSSRKSVILLDRLNQYREKKQPGRQEWITSLECVNAAGVTLPPCLIFKGENLNSGWIPDETPAGWKFITSKKGWTSDLIGFEWLKTHFQPYVSNSANSRHLLIMTATPLTLRPGLSRSVLRRKSIFFHYHRTRHIKRSLLI